ncbi:hypothetical protein ACP6PL_29700 [Dapis sp. BLCC M126]|uniref:hypothetical protein n=1 Tax=Dapis sp. BLCC M126 TaxID=3400189 RepID=UPI003CE7EE2B
MVCDCSCLKPISRQETEPWFQYNFGNGYLDKDDTVVVTLVRYADFDQINNYLQEVASGQNHNVPQGIFWQIYLEPESGRINKLLDTP